MRGKQGRNICRDGEGRSGVSTYVCEILCVDSFRHVDAHEAESNRITDALYMVRRC